MVVTSMETLPTIAANSPRIRTRPWFEKRAIQAVTIANRQGSNARRRAGYEGEVISNSLASFDVADVDDASLPGEHWLHRRSFRFGNGASSGDERQIVAI